MYCNFSKSQAIPLAIRVSSHPTRCCSPFQTLKHQSFSAASQPGFMECPFTANLRGLSAVYYQRTLGKYHTLKPRNYSTGLCHRTLGKEASNAKFRNVSDGICRKIAVKNVTLTRANSFCSMSSEKAVKRSGGRNHAENTLPWLAAKEGNGAKRLEKSVTAKSTKTSWEDAAEKFLKGSSSTVEDREFRKFDNQPNDYRQKGKEAKWPKNSVTKSGYQSSWGVSLENVQKQNDSLVGSRELRKFDDLQNDYISKGDTLEEEEEEEIEEVNDLRWNKIKNRFNTMTNAKPVTDRPEFRKWKKQENWGRKTWKEATESAIPKMIGEGLYGVGPVLAALSAGRREFYALYVQEGLDLSSNNRKKKDKKGFEQILRMAEKLGLSKKEVSKHDLNMVVDNRPHQGLVLDASPLELVKVKELDPVVVDGAEDNGLLWVALDEVTDPQNLGAIIRSAYFFGAAGVVLCAKNSAPLSGVVSKASAGSLELMELGYCKNMMQFLASSAENGWRILGGSVSSRAVPVNEIQPGAPTILVLGSEGTGLRPLVERSCTQLVRIPGNMPVDLIAGGVEDTGTGEMDNECSGQEFRSFLAVESLNVSVAAGVLLHHLTCSSGSNIGKLLEGT